MRGPTSGHRLFECRLHLMKTVDRPRRSRKSSARSLDELTSVGDRPFNLCVEYAPFPDRPFVARTVAQDPVHRSPPRCGCNGGIGTSAQAVHGGRPGDCHTLLLENAAILRVPMYFLLSALYVLARAQHRNFICHPTVGFHGGICESQCHSFTNADSSVMSTIFQE